MLGSMLENLRARGPLIHNITNYVTANDCANILLACGASPIMADDPAEAEEITALCDGLVLNMGTLHRHTIPAMLAAGKRANGLGHPVVLDPVGAGASSLRRETADRLLREIRLAVIRGNRSEIRALAVGTAGNRGVDADEETGKKESPEKNAAMLRAFSRKTGAVIVMTGEEDYAADGKRVFRIRNGHPEMRRVTGTGCQLSALTAAFVAANPDQPLWAAAAAVCAMGLCGEIAQRRLSGLDGTAAYRGYIIDAVSRLTPSELERGAQYEILEG